jgi:hypothetical protein
MTSEQEMMLDELLEVDEVLVSEQHCLDDWTKTFIHDLDETRKQFPHYSLSVKQSDKLREKWSQYCDDD